MPSSSGTLQCSIGSCSAKKQRFTQEKHHHWCEYDVDSVVDRRHLCQIGLVGKQMCLL